MEKRIITSEQQPNVVEFLNDGSYYYNYNPQETTISKQDDNNELIEVPAYTYTQVHIWGTPNYKDIAKAVIRAHISEDDEFDLINTYNRAVLFKEDIDTTEYKNYLELLDIIKANIKESLK